MPCFLVRQRNLSIDSTPPLRSLDHLTYPAVLTLVGRLAPKELFEPSETTSPRVTGIVGSPTRITIDRNTGVLSSESSEFLPAATGTGNWDTLPDRTISVNGSEFTYKLIINNQNDLHAATDFIVSTLTSSLSIIFGIFVDVVAIQGEIADQIKFTLVVAPEAFMARLLPLSRDTRDKLIFEAIDLQKQWIQSCPRLITASVYFQHALRFLSPHEVISAPYQMYSEVIINLAKCLEILLVNKAAPGQTNDKIRATCRLLGYTDAQIESQIIPIIVIRSNFDGAHAVGTKIPVEQTIIAKNFIDRSIDNVRSILIRTARFVKTNENFLPGLELATSSERTKLVAKLANYLEADKLPES